MVRIALHTRLRPGKEEEYCRVHARVPAVLDAALRGAGVLSWEIWRDGRDLFHLVEVCDYQGMVDALRDPVDADWDVRIAELVENPFGRELDKVWELDRNV